MLSSPVMAVNTTDMPQHFEVKYNGKISLWSIKCRRFYSSRKASILLRTFKNYTSTGVLV